MVIIWLFLLFSDGYYLHMVEFKSLERLEMNCRGKQYGWKGGNAQRAMHLKMGEVVNNLGITGMQRED